MSRLINTCRHSFSYRASSQHYNINSKVKLKLINRQLFTKLRGLYSLFEMIKTLSTLIYLSQTSRDYNTSFLFADRGVRYSLVTTKDCREVAVLSYKIHTHAQQNFGRNISDYLIDILIIKYIYTSECQKG